MLRVQLASEKKTQAVKTRLGKASTARVWQDPIRPVADGGRAEALLAWAEGDALLADGEVRAAQVAYEFAATQLRKELDSSLLATLYRRCAEKLEYDAGRRAHRHAEGRIAIK